MRPPELFDKEGLIRSMTRRGLDGIIVASPANIIYTTGLNLYSQTLIPERLVLNFVRLDGHSTLILFARERAQVERDSWVDDVRYYAEFGESPMSIVSRLLVEAGLSRGRIGIEMRYLSLASGEKLRRLLPEASLINCEEALEETRRIKTPKEVELLRGAAKLIDKAIWLASELVKPGDTESAFARQIVSNLLTLGEGSIEGPDGIVASGPNLGVMHHTSGDRRISRGDMIRYGCKATVQGYWFIILRMAAVGLPMQEQLSSYSQYAEVYHKTIELLRPGIAAREVFNSCKRAFEKRGLQLVSEKIGHSTGLSFRERPILQASEEMELEANMVLAFDFLVMDKHQNPYHVENRILITERGAEILSDVIDTRLLPSIG